MPKVIALLKVCVAEPLKTMVLLLFAVNVPLLVMLPAMLRVLLAGMVRLAPEAMVMLLAFASPVCDGQLDVAKQIPVPIYMFFAVVGSSVATE